MENNGRVDVFDHEGRSALHLAAEFGSIEVCEALLSKNAFINSKAKTGMYCIYALKNKYYYIVHFKMLVKYFFFLLTNKSYYIRIQKFREIRINKNHNIVQFHEIFAKKYSIFFNIIHT